MPPASHAEAGRWGQGPETAGAVVSEAPVGAIDEQRGGGQGQSQDDGGGEEAAEGTLDPRIQHVGDAVAMVCRYEQAQVVWSARIPLDPELLPETVLFMAYSPGSLDLRFETSCWEVRELLSLQLPLLRSMVTERLAGACAVSINL